MGLAFVGGFAGGLSKSIEKARDNKRKLDDAIVRENTQRRKELVAQQDKQYELGVTTQKAFDDINSRIVDIKSGEVELSESEAINEINYLNKQKLDTYKKSMDYGLTIGMEDPRSIIDITKQDIGQIGVYNSDDGRYVVNKELGEALDSNNGEIRVGKNGEVERWKVAQNSQGQWIPEKNANGDFKYESTGEFLPETTKVIKPSVAKKGRPTSLDQDKQSFQDLKDAQKAYDDNPTTENLANLNFAKDVNTKRRAGVGESAERNERDDVKASMNYGKDIIADPSTYNYDDSSMSEINFRYTDFYNKNTSLKKDETKFNEEVVSFNRNKGLFDVFDAAVKDGSYESGVATELKKIAVKYTEKEFTDMLKLDREKIKKMIGLEGQIGDGVAIYLKALSGTAAAQAEFVRTLNNFVGKDMTQEDVKQKVFGNFIEKKSRDLDTSARSITKRGLVHTGGSWLARNNKTKKQDSVSTEVVGGVEYETRTVNGTKQYKNPADDKWYK